MVSLGVFHVAAVRWWLMLEHSRWPRSHAWYLGGVSARVGLAGMMDSGASLSPHASHVVCP